MNKQEEAKEYAVNVDKFGFKASLEGAPTHLFNDEEFLSALPIQIRMSPEFEKLRKIYS